MVTQGFSGCQWLRSGGCVPEGEPQPEPKAEASPDWPGFLRKAAFSRKLAKNPLIEIMKAVKYLFALWAGVLIYASLSVAFGARGVSAYHQLQSEQKKQETNIENLKLINRELEETMNSLLYDEDTLAIFAREQGYASRQERFIRIVGLGGYQKTRTSAGEVVVAADPQHIADQVLRIIAFCMGITVFFCMAVFDFMKFLRER